MAKRKVLTAIAEIRADSSKLKPDLQKAEAEAKATAARIEDSVSTAAATSGSSAAVVKDAALASQIKGATKPARDLVSSVGQIFSMVTRILGIAGLITAAVVGIVRLSDQWINKQVRVRQELERANQQLRDINLSYISQAQRSRLSTINDPVERLKEEIRLLEKAKDEAENTAKARVLNSDKIKDKIKEQDEAYKEQGRILTRIAALERLRQDAAARAVSGVDVSGELKKERALYDEKVALERKLQKEIRTEIEKNQKLAREIVDNEIKAIQNELQREAVRMQIELYWEPLAKLTQEIRQLNQNLVNQGASIDQLGSVIDSLIARDWLRR